MNKKGEFDDVNAQKFWEECVSIKNSKFIFPCLFLWNHICTNTFLTFMIQVDIAESGGDLDDCGRDDILAKAMKVPEHPGRVRCAGFSVSQKVYFDSRKQNHNDSEQVRNLQAQLDELRKVVQEMQKQTQKKDIQIGTVPCNSGNDSWTPSCVDLPEVNVYSIQLLLLHFTGLIIIFI